MCAPCDLLLTERGPRRPRGGFRCLPPITVTHTYDFMHIQTVPLALPPSADPSKFTQFGREVIGVDPRNLSPAEFTEIERLLYTVRSTPKIPHPVPDPTPS